MAKKIMNSRVFLSMRNNNMLAYILQLIQREVNRKKLST